MHRSPGGTPVRNRAKSPAAGDPAAIIAAALKKRFAKMHVDSPEKDSHEDSNDFSSSPENTPQINRKSRLDFPKRSLILNEEKKTASAPQNIFKLLKKSSPRVPPKPREKEEEKPALPVVSWL